jgi:hypothetical protein
MNEGIKEILREYFEDMGLSLQFDEKHSCYISGVFEISKDITANAVQLQLRVYPNAFDINVYMVGYLAQQKHLAETMTFLGYLNNVLYPGTSVMSYPGGNIRVYRYVDCISKTAGNMPSIRKIHENVNIALGTYIMVMDLVVMVDLGYLSAADAFQVYMKSIEN